MKVNGDDYRELTEYAHADNTEIGNYVISLLCLRGYSGDHGMTGNMSDALNVELDHWLTRFRNECVIERTLVDRAPQMEIKLVWHEDK